VILESSLTYRSACPKNTFSSQTGCFPAGLAIQAYGEMQRYDVQNYKGYLL